MKVISEKIAFSQRLVKALKDAKIEAGSPTVFSREFNRRYNGKSVSIHAARKWLTGESIPTQDKLRLLAMWLGVSTEWLRFGEKTAASTHQSSLNHAVYSSPDFELLHHFNMLSNEHKLVAREVILTLMRVEGKN
jgi:transcriptional regulator with XRE-family HTH domain